MPMTDAFNSDIFSTISLTEAINKLPFKPSRIGQMGLFRSEGVRTTTITVEESAGLLALLPTKRRGEPATVEKAPKRTARSFNIPHIPDESTITAESIQNARAFGSETELDSIAREVNSRLTQMKQNHETTLEYHRVGAIQGKILDSDGTTVIQNLFTDFGVYEHDVDFFLDVSTTDVRAKILKAVRFIEDALGADAGVYDHIHCLCGKDFFDAFIGHTDVKDAYARWRDGEFLRSDPRRGFEFAGVVFEEYKGKVSNQAFIADSVARFFPVGVPNLFVTYYAPADFMETVNTIGRPLYSKQAPDPSGLNRFVTLHTQQNPLCLCMRPAVLVKGNQTEAVS